MAKKKPSPHSARRAAAKRSVKLVRDLDRLSRIAPGGAPDRPIDLDSASQVEIHAQSTLCPLCEGALRVEEHEAITVGSARLRVARVICKQCGSRRPIYFRLGGTLPS